jgi:catechol 2,3-dioxygenase-like lactoylglutathione lyase family enzyme
MRITHLRHVAIAAPRFEESRTFFIDAWGLKEVGLLHGRSYLKAQNAEQFQLVLVPGAERRIDRIAFGLAAQSEVDDAAYDLRAKGVTIVDEPHELDTPGGGYALGILDPDNRYIELSAEVASSEATQALALPKLLEHIVVNTPDIDRSTAFFRDFLGLRVSDWSEHQMSFLRCNPQHHVIAFNAAPYASYNHTAWGMGSLDELFRGQGRLRAQGVPLMWGTGRHGPGEYVFNYFIEPSGYVVEYSADGLRIDDESTWTPQVWQRSPQLMDTWGTAGPPSAEIREAMAGVPDRGYQPAATSA